MKKSTLILPLFMILSLISCKSGDSETSTEPTGLAMSKTVSWNTESSDTFIVDENVGTVKISGDLGGKNLYAANVNFSDDKISNIYFKYPGNISVSKSVAAFSESEALQNEDYSIAESESHAKFYD